MRALNLQRSTRHNENKYRETTSFQAVIPV